MLSEEFVNPALLDNTNLDPFSEDFGTTLKALSTINKKHRDKTINSLDGGKKMALKTINLKGKPHVEFRELLELAHERGLAGVSTEVLQFPNVDNGNLAVVKASIFMAVEGNSGKATTYTGIGDASPHSTNKMIAPHIIRMAETRAVGRAFRFALNIGLVMKQELGGSSNEGPSGSGVGEEHTKKQKKPPTTMDYIAKIQKLEKKAHENDFEIKNSRKKHGLALLIEKTSDDTLIAYGTHLKDKIKKMKEKKDVSK